MKTHQFLAVIAAFLFTTLGCSKKDTIDLSNTKAPEIKSILDVIQPDLNRADNIPLVCVVFAEAGLKSVKMKIVKGGVETDFKEVTTFYDNKQYSVKELPLWDDTFQSFKIIATDLGDRVTEKVIPISVIKYLAAPEIKFPVAEIFIDENTGSTVIPKTMFTVTGAAALSKVEVKVFSTSGTRAISLNPAFVPGMTYEYDGEIIYKAGDNALQVAATDVNGKIKIETLPIRYIAVPAPEIMVTGTTTLEPIVAASGTSKTLTFKITSGAGINNIRVFKLEKNIETLLPLPSPDTYAGQKDINFEYVLPAFTASMTGIKIIVTDQLTRATEVTIKTYIDLTYAPSLRAGSQFYSKVADPAYPGVYNFFSFKDMNTYPLSYFYANRPNIDLIFYLFNGGVRLYGANNSRPTNEPFAGDAANNIPFINTWTGVPRNSLKVKKYVAANVNFTFDNVTATDLKAASIQTYLNSAQGATDFADLVAGEAVYFQTASTSTNGVKTGIMKIESVTVDPKDNTKGFYVVSIKMAQ